MVTVQKITKPWGHEEIFAHTDSYVGKVLFIRSGEALSLQFHREKDETIRILDGELELVVGTRRKDLRTIRLTPGAVYHLPPMTIHRMIATADTHVLEVSTPQLEDVVRLEDRYGREGTNRP
ncbi:MAG: cupin domain-containing protein [Acidobacteria bacterium]|nr:cupin domain-containing protein [Acidobacteriota bacterium]